MKLLVVEDDPKIGGFLRKGLEAQGFIVDFADNGDEAYVLATTRSYDAIVLDIMLPGRDGLSILRHLRDQHAAVPVMLLTARSGLQEKLDGLNTGADDYLTKPFYIEELVARLHALLRRSSGQPKSVLQHDGLLVDLMTREVKYQTEKIELTAREFALLTYLLRSPGRTFTRAQICEHVWSYHFDPGTNLVDVYVQHVRKKLTSAGAPALIETIRGVGYRIPPASREP